MFIAGHEPHTNRTQPPRHNLLFYILFHNEIWSSVRAKATEEMIMSSADIVPLQSVDFEIEVEGLQQHLAAEHGASSRAELA